MTGVPRTTTAPTGTGPRQVASRHPLTLLRLASTLAAAAPFVLDPSGLDRWVFPKELCLVIAAALAWAVPAGSRMPRWWRWWLLSAGAALLVTAMLGAAPLPQFLGRWPRYEGMVTLGTYALAVTLGARLWGAHLAAAGDRARSLRDTGSTVLAAALSLTALLAVIEAFGGRPVASDLDRPGSLLGNASDLGVVGVISLALFLPRAAESLTSPDRRARLLVPTCGALSAALIVGLSASRAALIATAVVLVLTALLAARRRERRRGWWVTYAVTAGGTVGGALLLPLTSARVFGTSPHATDSAARRIDLWAATVDLVRHHPVLGVGPNGFADAVPAVLSDTWFAQTGLGGWTESPHDVPLQILAAGGLVGAMTAGSFLLLAVLGIRRRGLGGAFGGPAVVALAGGSVALLTHVTSPGPLLLMCLLAGSVLSVPTMEPERSPRWRRAGVVALAAWALALVLALAGDHALGRGLESLASGRPSDADRAFAMAATLRPWDADVPLRAAETYAAAVDSAGTAEDFAAAVEWTERATHALPASPRALLADAVIAQYTGAFPHAIDRLRQAASLSPVDPRIHHRLGGVLLLSGDIDGALRELERATALAPDDVQIRETLDYAHRLAVAP